jgi:mRNA interferase MazF
MRRGDIVVAKSRPALVIQGDVLDETARVTMLPLTSLLRDAAIYRIDVVPDQMNGLKARSQIAIDHIFNWPRDEIATTVGRLDATTLRQVDQTLATFLGFAA